MPHRIIGYADQCHSPSNRILVEHLRELEDGLGRKPRWSDVDMMDLYKIAHSMVVRDVVDRGRDYHIRYWGSEMTEAFGFDGTGKCVRDLVPETLRDSAVALYDEIVATARSFTIVGSVIHVPNKEHKTFEVVDMPLWDVSGNVSNIVSAYDWSYSGDDAIRSG